MKINCCCNGSITRLEEKYRRDEENVRLSGEHRSIRGEKIHTTGDTTLSADENEIDAVHRQTIDAAARRLLSRIKLSFYFVKKNHRKEKNETFIHDG